MMNLGNALQYLREEYSGTKLRLMELEQAISVIESLNRVELIRQFKTSARQSGRGLRELRH